MEDVTEYLVFSQHTVQLQIRWHTHAAGASLLRPMVKKKSEISCRQSSSTTSTVIKALGPVVKHATYARICASTSHTSILLVSLGRPYIIQVVDLVDEFFIVGDDVLRSNVL